MNRHLYLIIIAVSLSISALFPAQAKLYDATLTFIMYAPEQHTEEEKIAQDFRRNFTVVQPFDLTKKTNFYLQYILIDENFIQYEINRSGRSIETDSDTPNSFSDQSSVGSSRYEEYKKASKMSTQFSSGSREMQASIVVKPYRGTMVLYNSYGTELFRVQSSDHYKTESASLKNTIRQMRRAIDRQGDKMAIRQKLRCLFCDYGDLKERQKEKVDHLAFIVHNHLITQLYGEITEQELPRGIAPYANIYSSLKDYKALDSIFDTDAVVFDRQPGTRRLPGHLINVVIEEDAPEALINKIAAAYKKNDFQELDVNNLTPLWSAISQKNTALIERLISLGVGVNQVTNVNGSYITPLMLSAQYGDTETSKILLAHGARKELTTPGGLTAWSSAFWLAKYDHAELLWPDGFIDSGSLEAQNFYIQAAYYGQMDKVKQLIESGVALTSRGVNGDNLVISAIKGIKTFSIDPDFDLPGAASHRSGSNAFWNIIGEAEKSGLSNPLGSSFDILRQTVLFHAYPDGSNEVKDDHIALISRLIKSGIDPNTTNVNGQNADQVYQDARLTYLDGLYESQLDEINQQRRETAQLAQLKQDEAKDAALEALEEQGSFRSRSRAASQAKRLEAIERQDRMARENNFQSRSSNFERDTSDVDQNVNSGEVMKSIDENIREIYTNDVKLANDVAMQKIDELEEMIDGLKQDEVDNAASRQVKIARMVAEQ